MRSASISKSALPLRLFWISLVNHYLFSSPFKCFSIQYNSAWSISCFMFVTWFQVLYLFDMFGCCLVVFSYLMLNYVWIHGIYVYMGWTIVVLYRFVLCCMDYVTWNTSCCEECCCLGVFVMWETHCVLILLFIWHVPSRNKLVVS